MADIRHCEKGYNLFNVFNVFMALEPVERKHSHMTNTQSHWLSKNRQPMRLCIRHTKMLFQRVPGIQHGVLFANLRNKFALNSMHKPSLGLFELYGGHSSLRELTTCLTLSPVSNVALLMCVPH